MVAAKISQQNKFLASRRMSECVCVFVLRERMVGFSNVNAYMF